MTTSTYAAEAMVMAGATRVRAFLHQPCSASPALAIWSTPIGTTNDKHGRLRRLEVSHQ